MADAMPFAKYEFKVFEDEMSFAALMIHIATSNMLRFAQVKTLLADSFDYCIAQLDRFTSPR